MRSILKNFRIPLIGFLPLVLAAVYPVFLISDVVAANARETRNLDSEIGLRLERVEEFRFIREEAEKFGVRAWLFGGTAAGYGHYVRWDLKRENGDSRFQPDRFDYDYTNIYRSTQDLDIVIDGTEEQATHLQNALRNKYPHLQGSKSAWEVRLLKNPMGDKEALLDNPDYLNQHTDSNSTGMIEITKSNDGKSVVKDLRDWNAEESIFLKDLKEGKLHYYYSPHHLQTSRATKGLNPPILSAVRYLTKAFQYELELKPEDLKQVQKIIKDFDPKANLDPYVTNWIEKNGKKLIQNAINIEYAWDMLEKLGLRKKLAQINGDTDNADSLAWWMNKEPLRTKPIGTGNGKTAKALGLDIIAHETNSFLAYESITRAHTGDSNVLISRKGMSGEHATFGDGFYSRIGKEGARDTGLTIRFHLDPKAREGEDFIRGGDDFIIVQNKAAIRVIPESLNIGPVEFFRMLSKGELGINDSDKGIIEKLNRRIGAKSAAMTKNEAAEITRMVKRDLKLLLAGSGTFSPVLSEWFRLPIAVRNADWLAEVIQSGKADQIVLEQVLSQPHWSAHPELLRLYFKHSRWDWEIVQSVLSQPGWQNHPELIDEFIKRDRVDRAIAEFVLSQPHWKDHPEFIKAILKKGSADGEIANFVLSKPHWKDHPELVAALIKRGTQDWNIVYNVLSGPHWVGHPGLIRKLLKKNHEIDASIASAIISEPHWRNDPELVEILIKRGKADREIVRFGLSQTHWKDHPEFIEALIRGGKANAEISSILSLPHWKDHPELRRVTDGAVPTLENLRSAFSRGLSLVKPGSKACAKLFTGIGSNTQKEHIR